MHARVEDKNNFNLDVIVSVSVLVVGMVIVRFGIDNMTVYRICRDCSNISFAITFDS